jgi:hypothetical protein
VEATAKKQKFVTVTLIVKEGETDREESKEVLKGKTEVAILKNELGVAPEDSLWGRARRQGRRPFRGRRPRRGLVTEATERERVLTALRASFGEAEEIGGGEPFRVRLSRLLLPDPWRPQETGAMLVFEGWPQNRPLLYVEEAVVGETGQPPRSNHAVLFDGETWRGFSFAFPWAGNDPVRAVQLWLSRFTVERS